VFVVGPVEELVFRGYLLGRLCELVRPGWAAVLSAVAFGLWHFPGGQDWLQVGTTTLIGLALAVIRLRVRGASIPALGLGHGLYDAGLAVAAFLAG
jgi:membrane protease YdiL (CAAX protease family)